MRLLKSLAQSLIGSPGRALRYFLPQTIFVISGSHVVFYNWSFVVNFIIITLKLCGWSFVGSNAEIVWRRAPGGRLRSDAQPMGVYFDRPAEPDAVK